MAQLRQDYPELQKRGAAVLAVGPEAQDKLAAYWAKHELPFAGLPDPEHTIANLYGQEAPLTKGRMPALLVIDQAGRVRYEHYGKSMRDLAPMEDVLAVLDGLASEA
jgi:peroxiredoxin